MINPAATSALDAVSKEELRERYEAPETDNSTY